MGAAMTSPLFSTYRGGENRITSSTIAVFERVDLPLVRELLQSATGMGDELSGVSFENQVFGDGLSVPDARISARFTWWFETKTVPNAYASEGHSRRQVRSHSSLLTSDSDAWLFVLTPDPEQPSWFSDLDGVEDSVRGRVIWFSFAHLAAVIREVLSDAARLLSEQTRFLLTELIALYEADGLLSHDDTVIVAARAAWGEYLTHAAYVCQPNRSFRAGLTHFGFYYDGQIMAKLPRIVDSSPAELFTEENIVRLRGSGRERLATAISRFIADGSREEGSSHGVVVLSGPDDADTVQLYAPIVNDTVTANGRNWAWTLSQRYTRRSRLTSGTKRTSEL
jgi:hypothetical protein